MLILGIDSSDDFVSVGIAGPEGTLVSVSSQPEQRNKNVLHALLVESLTKIKMSLDNLNGIAVALGPGSFTGLRVGLAAAKGLGWSLNLPLAGVSSLTVIAHASPIDGRILAIKDARRSEFYYGGFEKKGYDIVRLIPDSVGTSEDITRLISENFKPVGPGLRALSRAGDTIDPNIIGGTIARLGRQMILAGEKLDISSASPSYIRMPGLGQGKG